MYMTEAYKRGVRAQRYNHLLFAAKRAGVSFEDYMLKIGDDVGKPCPCAICGRATSARSKSRICWRCYNEINAWRR